MTAQVARLAAWLTKRWPKSEAEKFADAMQPDVVAFDPEQPTGERLPPEIIDEIAQFPPGEHRTMSAAECNNRWCRDPAHYEPVELPRYEVFASGDVEYVDHTWCNSAGATVMSYRSPKDAPCPYPEQCRECSPAVVVALPLVRGCDHCGKELGEIACQSRHKPGVFCSAACADWEDPDDPHVVLRNAVEHVLTRHTPWEYGYLGNGEPNIRCRCRRAKHVQDWPAWRRHVAELAAEYIEKDRPAPADR